uniref:Uncharacterized protein n=1 Tax=Dulem virus 33 TaxID=3145751 RepID=A0AAU8B5I2_9CAUD
MSMKALDDLRDMLCDELDEIAKKPEMSAGDLETVHKLTDTIKNIDKICLMEEDGEYSQAGDWELEGRGNYGRGNSYANRGQHYVRGHYSRDGGQGDGYSRRGGRGGYSRADGKDRMMEHLNQMMQEAGSEKERNAIRRCMEQMENA